uniref:Uncharacterized protein n=1 Tax=Anguilla anguilla TaxID=7936 RepID=A0A0E9RIV8_ANGAN
MHSENKDKTRRALLLFNNYTPSVFQLKRHSQKLNLQKRFAGVCGVSIRPQC